MWIALGILGFIALLITFLLCMRASIVIKSDEAGELQLRYRYLFLTFGEEPNPDDPIVKAIKKSAGITRFEKEQLKLSVERSGLAGAVEESLQIIRDLLVQVVGLLKHCKAERLELKVVCATGDAAETAIRYGQISAAAYSFVSLLQGIMKVSKRGCRIDIRCDFTGQETRFDYHAVISVSLGRVLAAFFRIAYAEAKRTAQAGGMDPSAKN